MGLLQLGNPQKGWVSVCYIDTYTDCTVYHDYKIKGIITCRAGASAMGPINRGLSGLSNLTPTNIHTSLPSFQLGSYGSTVFMQTLALALHGSPHT